MESFLPSSQWQQLEISGLKTPFFHLSGNLGFSDNAAEAVCRMCISVFIKCGAIDIVRLTTNSNGQAATFSFQTEFALAATGFYDLGLGVLLGFRLPKSCGALVCFS